MITDLFLGTATSPHGGAIALFAGSYRSVNAPLYLVAAGEFQEVNNTPSILQFLVPLFNRLREDTSDSHLQLSLDELRVRYCNASQVARDSLTARCRAIYEALRLSNDIDSLAKLLGTQQGLTVPMPVFRRTELKGDDAVLAARWLSALITSGKLLSVGEGGQAGAGALAVAAESDWESDNKPPMLVSAACHALYPWAVGHTVNGRTGSYTHRLKSWVPSLDEPPNEVVELPKSLFF